MYDICIIGAGASGLTAAVAAARKARENDKECKIVVVEKNDSAGKKILATGSGRCNITNSAAEGFDETVDFFRSIGVVISEEENGFCYPMSRRAEDVVTALYNAALAEGAEFMFGANVKDIKGVDNFSIEAEKDDRPFTIKSDKVIIASGGKSAPQYGTVGDSYVFARKLGHSVTRTAPALTAVETRAADKSIAGVRIHAVCRLLKDSSEICSEKGELQINDGSISGICVMDLTKEMFAKEGDHAEELKKYSVIADLAPALITEDLIKELSDRRNIKWMTAGTILNSIVPSKLSDKIIEKAGADRNKAAADLTDREIGNIAFVTKNYEFPVVGLKGWKNAQSTLGGVSGEEIDHETMESRLVNNLYFTGEATENTFTCGGFNLQNAWITGLRAGRAAAE